MSIVPALPGVALFGAAFGALAAERGLTTLEAVVMSGIVFAGVAQIASMELWSPQITPALVLTIAFTALVINLRMLLMSASMRPWLASGRSDDWHREQFLKLACWVLHRQDARGGWATWPDSRPRT